MYHARKSILRTARLHKERDRANRRQHAPPVSWREKTSGHWKGDGYHVCRCSACGAARDHWSRQSIKRISEGFDAWFEATPKPDPIKVLMADAPDPSVRSIFDSLRGLAYSV